MITRPGRIVQWFDAEGRPIEIGQKRENMKKFNLEEALQGKPVVTRDGRKVSQLVLFKEVSTGYPLRAVIDGDIYAYSTDGVFYKGRTVNDDLFMESAKRKGWVNIYDAERGGRFSIDEDEDCYKGSYSEVYASARVYKTQAKAAQHAEAGLIATVRIEWEE